MKTALITGITGQDGSYLAELLLSKGYEVHGILRRSSSFNTKRIDHIFDRLHLHFGDLTDSNSMMRVLQLSKPDEIYNLGAQSHVRVSFDTPVYTAETDATAYLGLLEDVRALNLGSKIYQAGSSEMFGKVQQVPQSETTPFYPRSPYGVAKQFAHWIGINYRESYDMFIANGILFNHECVTEETPIIFRLNGVLDIKEIQDLVPHREDPTKGKKYQSVPKGLEIWDGDKWSLVTAATATWNGGEKCVYDVSARGGAYRATGDHISFLKGKKETTTSSLEVGQELQLFPLPQSTDSSSVNEKEAEFLGLMAGDGYVCSEGGSARFTNTDTALLDRCASLFNSITCGNSRLDFSKVSGFTGEVVPSVEFSNASGFFSLWRKELYNERGLKKVPIRVLNGTAAVRLAFLSGYNKADGLKAGNFVNREFKSFKTNSSVLAQGLCFLCETLGYRVTVYMDRKYYSLNIGLPSPKKGAHLQKSLEEIRVVAPVIHTGWLFDLATESGTFSAGVGRTWVHNSPRRGETFVTRKITKAVARICMGLQDELALGNLDAKRDWGFAKEYVEAMWLMLQQPNPDDFVIATGETRTIREFLDVAFEYAGLDWHKYVTIDPKYYRPTEVDLLVGDASKAKEVLGWEPKMKFKQLVHLMVDADMKSPAL